MYALTILQCLSTLYRLDIQIWQDSISRTRNGQKVLLRRPLQRTKLILTDQACPPDRPDSIDRLLLHHYAIR